jgi:hypothetical protein
VSIISSVKPKHRTANTADSGCNGAFRNQSAPDRTCHLGLSGCKARPSGRVFACDEFQRATRPVNDDLVMIRALRVLLPRYDGTAQRLYRGETAYNRKRRTYGLSWSSKLDVADHYGKSGVYRSSVGGSVVLEVQANPDAIICAPLHHDNRYGEDEYLVDRRKLAGVKVLRRYPQEFKR